MIDVSLTTAQAFGAISALVQLAVGGVSTSLANFIPKEREIRQDANLAKHKCTEGMAELICRFAIDAQHANDYASLRGATSGGPDHGGILVRSLYERCDQVSAIRSTKLGLKRAHNILVSATIAGIPLGILIFALPKHASIIGALSFLLLAFEIAAVIRLRVLDARLDDLAQE
jgi:hypothetical protein